jgi:hypothetical protein
MIMGRKPEIFLFFILQRTVSIQNSTEKFQISPVFVSTRQDKFKSPDRCHSILTNRI